MLPFEKLEALGSQTEDGHDARVAQARRGLCEIIESAAFQEALWLSSPALHAALSKQAGALDEKLERAALRYASRMCARATPYGTFAAISVVPLGNETRIHLAPLDQVRKQIEPDIEPLSQLVRRWAENDAVRERLRFWPTPQRNHSGHHLHCAPFQLGTDQPLSLVEIRRSPHLDGLLDACQAGLTIEQMIELLATWLPRASRQARQRFVLGLIREGVLISDLVPTSTGLPPLRQLIDRTETLPGLEAEHVALQGVRAALDRLEESPQEPPERGYAAVAELLRSPPLSAPSEIPVRVDAWRPAPGSTLGPDALNALRSAAELLLALPPRPSQRLERFVERFVERYDSRYVPLLEALDEDTGVGFAKSAFQDRLPLLDGLEFGSESRAPASLASTEQRLFVRLLEAASEGKQELSLTQQELVEARPGKAREGYTLFAKLVGTPGDIGVIEPMLLSPSGALYLTRFCNLSPEIAGLLHAMLAREQEACPDLLVDLVDFPPGRIANVVFHPVLRTHELVYQGRSGAPPERQLEAADLLLGFTGDRLVLYSKKLGRHVRVRSTNAFDTAHPGTLPVLDFLGQLSTQEASGRLLLDWGPLGAASWLPRLRVGKTILKPASWRLGDRELKTLKKLRGVELQDEVKRMRERLRLPRWLALVDGDNSLPIDLDNPLSVEMWCQEMQPGQARFYEFLPATLPRLAQSAGGSHVCEVVMPFASESVARPWSIKVAQESVAATTLPPGGEVLYAVIHGAPAILERFLLDQLEPLLRGERWFFVRYEDAKGQHLRLRVFGSPERLWGELFQSVTRLVNAAIASGDLQSLAFDTYQREHERYGGLQGVVLVEQIFCADSQCIASLLGLEASVDARWRMAALSIDHWLEAAGQPPAAKLATMERAARSYFDEFGAAEELSRSLGTQFRTLKSSLDEAFDSQEAPWVEARALLEARSAATRESLTGLAALEARGALSQSLASLMHSILHMSNDRIFDRTLRAQELVLFSLMERRYRALLARAGR